MNPFGKITLSRLEENCIAERESRWKKEATR